VTLDAPAARVTHRLALRGVGGKRCDGCRERSRPIVDEQAGFLFDDHFRIAADRSGNHGQCRRHGFQDGERHAFVGRAVDVNIKGRHQRPDVASMPREMYDVADAEGVRTID